MSVTTALSFALSTDLDTAAATYATASQADKATLRTGRQTAMTAAVMAGDIELAQHLGRMESVMVATKPVVLVNYGQLVADRYATALAIVEAIESGSINLPDGATALVRPLNLAGGTVDTAAVAAATTITARKAKGDVVAWLQSVVDDTPATIAQLRGRWTPTSDYATGAPSAGAIGAAFIRIADGAEAPFSVVADADGKGHVGAVA